MNVNNWNIEEINRKNEIIDKTIIKLKQDFVGIDEQIDQVMNQIRTWYVYPKLQSSPVVVCIWGLTGTGKTSLLKKIVKYLDIEEDMVYFNFAEINEKSAYEVESDIEDQLSNEKSNRFFVYDEFQYAATLDGHGEEKDNKNGLKPFWELLDSGIIHKRSDYRSSWQIVRIINYIRLINGKVRINIKDGIWQNSVDCLSQFNEYEKSQFEELLNFNLPSDSKMDVSRIYNEQSGTSQTVYNENRLFIKSHVIEHIFNFMSSIDNEFDRFEAYKKLRSMNEIDEVIFFIGELYKKMRKGYDLNFKDSIIFIVGNLDEAYTIAFDVDPDMSPDRFNKISKTITVVDIKKALQKRFRNEQIARMGNSHIIYPAFSSEAFRQIINLNLNQYIDKVKEMCGFNIVFDKTINKLIYNESVYPTHGTRPIFSTIQEVIKTKLPMIVRLIYDDKINDLASTLKYSYKKNKLIVGVYGENKVKIKEYDFKLKLRLTSLRKSTKDEEQAMCALHESGHFVVYTKLFGEMPEKLVSKTSDSDTGGFLMKPFDNKKIVSRSMLINEIMVTLGGYVVEKKYFGVDKMSCGASNDLKQATMIASEMIRNYGMGEDCVVTTYLKNPNEGGHIVCEEDQHHINDQIRDIIKKCLVETEKIFEDEEWCKMLKKSALYLSEHSNMPKSKMVELYDSVKNDRKVCQNDRYYRDKIQNIIN